MKRFALAVLVVLIGVAVASSAFAGAREREFKELYFGDSFHKSPAGIKLTDLQVYWNEQGVTQFRFELSAWKGKIVWDDVYFVGKKDGNPVLAYKLSDKQKLGLEFCVLDCPFKRYYDTLYITTPVGPFDGETGEVWFMFHFGGQVYEVIWSLKTNEVNWYKAQDKPAPNAPPAAPPAPPAEPK